MAFGPISHIAVDLQERAFSRLLMQFKGSAVLIDIMMAFILEAQELQDTIKNVIDLRGPADANGEQLDGLGRIVGQPRELFDYSLIDYFAPDTAGQSVDQAPVWVQNAPLAENLEADDEILRRLIEAKVYRNFTQYGSVLEIQAFVRLAFGYEISIVRSPVNKMEIYLVVGIAVPKYVINYLTWFRDSAYAEGIPFAPYADTVSVGGVLFLPPTPFQSDIEGAGADIGTAAVLSQI